MVKASCNHDATAVLKEKIEVLREEDKDKGVIIIKSLLKNEGSKTCSELATFSLSRQSRQESLR